MLQYATIGRDGSILGVDRNFEAAIDIAKRRDPGAKISAQRIDNDGLEPNADASQAIEQPGLALRHCGISPISRESVMRLTLPEAHELLFPYFDGLRKRGLVTHKYDTVVGMSKAWTGQNYKTSKAHEIPSKVLGLTLVPAAHPRLAAEGEGPFKWLLSPERRRAGLPMIERWRSELPEGLPRKFTFCQGSSKECRDSCLAFAGQNASEAYNNFRKVAQSMALLNQPAAFMRMLVDSIEKFQRSAAVTKGARVRGSNRRKSPMAPFFRLNVLSDIPWELVAPWLFTNFPDLQFYDYTKVPGRLTARNYDLTFSVSGTKTNRAWADEEIRVQKRRVAVVFLGKKVNVRGDWAPILLKGERLLKAVPLPETFWGLPVRDGDISDVRPRDPSPSVVALRWKTPSSKRSGTEVDPTEMAFVTPVYVVSRRKSVLDRPNPNDDDQWLIAPVSPRMQPIDTDGHETDDDDTDDE